MDCVCQVLGPTYTAEEFAYGENQTLSTEVKPIGKSQNRQVKRKQNDAKLYELTRGRHNYYAILYY